jgi:glycosyltransferase involved in cell wall biosynthesis
MLESKGKLKKNILSNNKETPKIGILSYPGGEKYPNTIPLSHLMEILNGISPKLFIILGKNEQSYHKKNINNHFLFIKNYKINNTILRILKEILIQIKICCKIININKKVKIWLFFIGGDTLVLPMIIAKILRRKVILLFGGSSIQVSNVSNDPLVFGLKIQSKINCMFSDKIILYSKIFIKKYNFEKWSDKVSLAHEHFINFSEFNIKKKLVDRKNLIGYIGRFSEEKGIFNLLFALTHMLNFRNNFNVTLIGEGKLREKIEYFIFDNKLQDKARIQGWVSHDKLPDYLNELKLLVLPSYSEGLPNIILEAMACGTPVLSTSVGAIPDIIKDCETGFLMENNSPECIAENIIRAFNHPSSYKIIKNARKLVEKEFTFESSFKRFEKIVDDIKG